MPQDTETVPPNPIGTIESMRALGYDLSDAVADLIDNSIAAGAKRIWIISEWAGPNTTYALIDDGAGMGEDQLREAMRVASRSPLEEREPHDLGRFGLGLKTAGWSQGRRLSVTTRRAGGQLASRCWDLDLVADSGEWSLIRNPDPEASEMAAQIQTLCGVSGTCIRISKLDRGFFSEDLSDDLEAAKRRHFATLDDLATHLGVVFHRFLTGRGKLVITINGTNVSPWDPFLASNSATQQLPEERFTLTGSQIRVQPYVLPHKSKLSANEHAHAAGPLGWNAQQGFYVYRARRLIVSGGYLGLKLQSEEHAKLARIAVDIDNTLDAAWEIDIRKATAVIPAQLRADFDRIAKATRRRATEAYRFRGKLERHAGQDQKIVPVWKRKRTRPEDPLEWVVNREHPTIEALMLTTTQQSAMKKMITAIEKGLPLESIRIAMGIDSDTSPPQISPAEITREIELALEIFARHGFAASDALDRLARAEPYDRFPEVIQALREKLK